MSSRLIPPVAALSVFTMLQGCGASSPRFATKEQSPKPSIEASTDQLQGVASYYAEEFDGRPTASGEIYDMNGLTAAHRTLPFNTVVRVRNLENNRSVTVRINDRGPFKDNRVIDLSFRAAEILGLIPNGTARVSIEIVKAGDSSK